MSHTPLEPEQLVVKQQKEISSLRKYIGDLRAKLRRLERKKDKK